MTEPGKPTWAEVATLIGGMDPTVARIIEALQDVRFNYTNEIVLHRGIQARLNQVGIPVADTDREVRLSDTDRIDFLIGHVGMEVKVGGTRGDVWRQLARYARHDRVQQLILVTSRAQHLRGAPSVQSGDTDVIEASGHDDAWARAHALAADTREPVDMAYNDGARWLLAAWILTGCPTVLTVALVPPGTSIRHPEWTDGEPENLDVTGVSPPDADGMVTIAHTSGTVYVNAEMIAEEVTAEDADMTAIIILAEQERMTDG